MNRALSLAVLVAALALLAGPAGATGAPAACPQAPAAAAVAALFAAPAPAAVAPAAGLSTVLAAPATGGISTTPQPRFDSCTVQQCRMGCHVFGCTSVCTDLSTCSCDVICP